ncbi:glycoside hydrolase family 43 protein [Mucilaginibacter gracilis]|nr:glycoside hydrolase 43 family protein [Mucilaginibacter gracilis]
MFKALYVILLVAASVSTVLAQTAKWGDQHNGTYANPILPADFHDTDVIRVGSDYFLVSATNQLSPGILIMQSKDMVNWKIVGHAVNDITRISASYNYDKLQGRGITASAIRYHDNEFLIYFTDPDEGVFMTSAGKISGPWSPLIQLIKGPGWGSPCPLWNDAGDAYLAATNFADNYKVHLFKMANNGESITMPGNVIQQGKAAYGGKLYKIKNYYYHFYSELTAEGRVLFAERSANVTGPYTEHHQLMHKADHEPNQASMVQNEKGDWYLIAQHSQARWDGRELSLLPVTWVNDWPVAGTLAGDGIGEMAWTARKPATDPNATPIQTSDDFSSKTLSPQWEWCFQPNAEKWSVTERAGYLRLYASKVPQPEVIEKIPNVITQRPWRLEQSIATVKFDIAHMTDGQIAAMCLFGKTTGIFGVKQNDNLRHIYFSAGGITKQGLQIEIANVWLRAIWDANGLAKFYYSTDGVNYDAFGDAYSITNVDNDGAAKIGIYTASDNESGGFIDIDWFHYGLN